MCLEIYIGSARKLELPEFDSGFSISPLGHFGELNLIERILDANYYYAVRSHTGCACGFRDPAEDNSIDPEKRKSDLEAFHDFLMREMKQNELRLFCTWWKNLSGVHPVKSIDPDNFLSPGFLFEEDIVLELIKSPVNNPVKQSS